MIDYYMEIFNKPMVLWTFLEELAIAGLFIGLVVVVTLICLLVELIVIKIKGSKVSDEK